MSEERVTAKADEQKNNKSWSIDDERIRQTSGYIRHTFKGRFLYHFMMFLMFIEGIIWSVMDIVRAWRMKIAAKIYKQK